MARLPMSSFLLNVGYSTGVSRGSRRAAGALVSGRKPAVNIWYVPTAGDIGPCVHHLEMSLFLPFRNVTVAGFGRWVGAEPVRSAAPARRPPHGPRASVSPLGL